MSDETLKNRLPEDNKPETTQQQLQGLGRRVNELLELLRSQREILQKRGMNLPSGAFDSMRTLKARVDNLAKTITGSQIELRQLRGLVETAALINSSLSTEEVLNQVMDTVIGLVGAERGYIVLKNRETGELEDFPSVARGMDQEQLDKKKELVISKTIVNDVFHSGQPLLTDNASQDERYQDQRSIVGFALRSILAVPLKVRDEIIGVVYCDNRIVAGLFKAHELQVLTAFANQAAVALENARLFESARARLLQVTEVRDLMDNIFTSIVSGVLTLDSQDNIRFANTVACEIMEIENLIGNNLRDMMPPVEERFYETIRHVRSKREQLTFVLEPTLKEGGTRYWNFIISPLRDQSDISQGVTIVLEDQTLQRTLDAQFAETKRYLPSALVANLRSADDFNVGAQEREITAFACDVRGFTNFSKNLDPQELMTVINKYLSLASDAINLFEGIVEKYMGDAVTGLFNTHLNPQPDHAKRAVQAALQLIFDLRAQHEVMDEHHILFYGIGIHTGPAVLGNVGSEERKEFAAMGDAVNISKYLESNADKGEIVISEDTYHLVADSFECEPVLEMRRPKEGYEHIKMYKVLKRKRGAQTGSLFLDPELLALLDELKDE